MEGEKIMSEDIEIELNEKDLLKICMLAHESDLTLNQYINFVLEKYIGDLNDKEITEEH